MKRVLLVMLVLLSAGCTQNAGAAAPRLYVVAEQAPGQQVADPSRFSAIIGYPDQCVTGIPCWTYTKGTRSAVSTYPESWYLHVNGVRVVDDVYHLYVMDPRSAGWQQHVAQVCGETCFIDALGPGALARDTPAIPWTPAEWVAATTGIVKAVVAAGKRAMPNNVGSDPVLAAQLVQAAGRGSDEAFDASTAQRILAVGHIWVSERGGCLSKYAAFLKYRGRGDHFSCYEFGTAPWDTGWMSGG